MSTMYYVIGTRESLGQTHSLAKNKGYHFTWCMYPLDFARFYHNFISVSTKTVVDEYGIDISMLAFIDIVQNARSMSFDERIAE